MKLPNATERAVLELIRRSRAHVLEVETTETAIDYLEFLIKNGELAEVRKEQEKLRKR